MATILKPENLKNVKDYEPPLNVHRGINSKTVEKTMLTMSHVYIPPAGRNQRHYHVKCDAYHYILKGRLRCFIGPDHEMEEFVVEPGDFVFVPQGVIHGLMNLSNTETAEILGGYCGVGHADEAETVKVEPLWDK